jgi:hypothetical protein
VNQNKIVWCREAIRLSGKHIFTDQLKKNTATVVAVAFPSKSFHRVKRADWQKAMHISQIPNKKNVQANHKNRTEGWFVAKLASFSRS